MTEDRSPFDGLVTRLGERVAGLTERVQTHPEEAASVLEETLSELSVSVEELEVASEELHHQTRELEVAAEHLEAERRRYAELFDLAPDGYLVTDAHGKIIEANRVATALLGSPRGGVVGSPLALFFAAPDHGPMFSTLRSLVEGAPGPVDLEIELRPRRAPAVPAWVRAAGSRLDEKPTIRWILRDISDQVAARRRIEEASLFKDAVLLAVSHDLRSPIWGLAALVERVADPETAPSPEKVQEMVAAMLEATRNVQAVVTNLLDIDRLGRGHVDLVRRPTDMAELVDRCLANAGLRERVRAEVPPFTALVDPGLTERIVCNLLANAERFSPPETEIAVEISEAMGGGVRIQVDDGGPGIPDESKEAVFGLFSQLSQSRVGGGVGLYLVQQFAHLHGGRAWVEDKPGGGASVRVLLPPPAD